MLEASPLNTLGLPAPTFSLPTPDGTRVSLDDFADADALLVMFICNHCPFVLHIAEGIADFVRDYQQKGLQAVAISANNITTHPEDAPEKMAQLSKEYGFTFPYLYDESQTTAKAYDAVCTPEFLLFDKHRNLYYRGQFDGSRPYTEWDIKLGKERNTVAVTGEDLRAATDALLAGKAAPSLQIQSMGCNIKWKLGNEPN